MDQNTKFLGNYIIRGKFKCLTGLHIGGSKEKLEIGGVDSPVVRDPRTRYPYVPGSSLKGKLRSLLEFGLGVVPASGDVSNATEIVRLFGIGVDEKEAAKKPSDALYNIGPSRLVVRDSHPSEATIEWWKKLDTDLLYTEYKSENGINRITSAANPRFIERVAKDSEFEFEMIYSVYNLNNEHKPDADANEDLSNLRMALLMLEHNFLGKSGSRGYGRVEFRFQEPVFISQDDYKSAKADKIEQASRPLDTFDNLLRIDKIDWTLNLQA